MTDLFSARGEEVTLSNAPLATRMRPRTIDEVVGQPQLLEAGAAFRRVVESGRQVSMLLWGPPGTGKTTLARVIANHADAEFVTLSATSAGVREIRAVLADAKRRMAADERPTVLLLDEIHRFAKNQQDALLPGVEDGTIALIGATTENPYFEVNAPLMSRMTLFRLHALGQRSLIELLQRALRDEPDGLGRSGLSLPERVGIEIAGRTGGDARQALNSLEVAALLAEADGRDAISLDDAAQALQQRIVRYDKTGDSHYDVISALIKSVRGSDPDAALYWLFLMLKGGEDPEFIARRLIILASEDVGLADPNALSVAVAAADALAYVGLPEANYHLSHAVLYLSAAPKSNSVDRAMEAAKDLVENGPPPAVPSHLRSTGYSGAAALGHGEGYLYPHSYPDGLVAQQYFPDGVPPTVLYKPGDAGDEERIAERLQGPDTFHRRDRRSETRPPT